MKNFHGIRNQILLFLLAFCLLAAVLNAAAAAERRRLLVKRCGCLAEEVSAVLEGSRDGIPDGIPVEILDDVQNEIRDGIRDGIPDVIRGGSRADRPEDRSDAVSGADQIMNIIIVDSLRQFGSIVRIINCITNKYYAKSVMQNM